MAIMLGSFSKGLFGGAQSAFQLYQAYQGLQTMWAQQDALDQTQQARDDDARNAGIESTVNKLRDQYGTPGGADDKSQPPPKPVDATADATPATPSGNETKPVKTENLPKPSGLAFNPAASTDAYRAPASTGVPDTHDAQRQQDLTKYNKPIWNQNNPVGTETLNPPPPVALSPDYGTGAGSGYGGGGLDAYGQTIPGLNPVQVVRPPQPPPQPALNTGTPVTPGVTAPPPTPPAPQQQGPSATPSWAEETRQRHDVPGAPPTPTGPAAIPTTPPGSGGAPVPGGIPQASNAPAPSLGVTIGSALSGLNPVGSAQAAEPRMSPSSQALTPAQTEPQPAPTPAPAPAPAAPAAGITPPTPAPAAPVPAKPPTTAPAAPAAAPVPVTGGKVAPGQSTPSVQSETPPVVMAPAISPKAWLTLSQTNPALATKIQAAVDKYGRGVVTPEMAAAVAERESGFNETVKAGDYATTGSEGLMQVTAATAASMQRTVAPNDPKWDQTTAEGSLAAGVSYLATLSLDYGYGVGTVQTMYGYLRGPGGVQRATANLGAEQQQEKIAWDGLAKAYGPDVKFQQAMFNGGNAGPNSKPYDVRNAVAEQIQGGPDKVLNWLITNGPDGAPVSDKWRMAQASFERAAVLSGHMDMLPHIQDWIAQQSHQGALSNLAAADNALSTGNAQLAAQFLSKSHAFFPDGTYARFGVDPKGQLWGEQIHEGSGTSMGKPVQITSDMLRQQMVVLQNPSNYVGALQKYQLENAQINMVKNHAEYYHEMPQMRKDIADQTDATRRAGIEAANSRAQLRADTQEQIAATKAGNQDADARSVGNQINKDYAPDAPPVPGELASQLPRQSQVDTILRRNNASGGASMAGPLSRQTANEVIKGTAKLQRGTDANGSPRDAVIGADGVIRGYLSTDQGDRIRGLAGSQKLQSSPTGSGPIRTSSIGVGGGSSMAAMQGLNQNLSGMSTQPMPQQQQAVG